MMRPSVTPRSPWRMTGVAAGIALASMMTMPTQAKAEWIYDMLSEQCSPEARDVMAQAKRAHIEASVRRAEAAITPPAPLGDLSCLTDLMQQPLDFFSGGFGLDSIFGNFGQLFDSFSNLGLDTIAVDGINSAICRFAEEKWGEVTGSLASLSLPDLTGLTLNPISDLGTGGAVPSISGSFNIPQSSAPSSTRTVQPPTYAPLPPSANTTEPADTTDYAALEAQAINDLVTVLQQRVVIPERTTTRQIVRQELDRYAAIYNNP